MGSDGGIGIGQIGLDLIMQNKITRIEISMNEYTDKYLIFEEQK